MNSEEDFTCMYDVFDALEQAIKQSHPDAREILATTLDAYMKCCPDDFFWATGAQSPTLLSNLLIAIDTSCRPTKEQLNALKRKIEKKADNAADLRDTIRDTVEFFGRERPVGAVFISDDEDENPRGVIH